MANLFKGKKLFRDDKEVDSSELLNKMVGLYFSACWCPPCRQFTPMLKEHYESWKGEPFDIIFLSFDRSSEDCELYYKNNHGLWYRMEHNDPYIEELKNKYNVTGIPKLVILNRKEEVISLNGREDIQEKDVGAMKYWKDAKCC